MNQSVVSCRQSRLENHQNVFFSRFLRERHNWCESVLKLLKAWEEKGTVDHIQNSVRDLPPKEVGRRKYEI